jgi:hypothetical protein
MVNLLMKGLASIIDMDSEGYIGKVVLYSTVFTF